MENLQYLLLCLLFQYFSILLLFTEGWGFGLIKDNQTVVHREFSWSFTLCNGLLFFPSLAALPSVVLVLAVVWHWPTFEWKHKLDSCHKHALSNCLTMKPFNDPGTVWTLVMENTFSSPFEGGFRWKALMWRRVCSLLSPREVKARRTTFTKREKGCA